MQRNDILYEKNDGVAVATFDRPQSLNAFRQSTFDEFLDILQDVRADDAVRVLVLTGTGRAFSAGVDLAELAHLFGAGALPLKETRAQILMYQDITRRMVNHPKTIIAAVNGLRIALLKLEMLSIASLRSEE